MRSTLFPVVKALSRNRIGCTSGSLSRKYTGSNAAKRLTPPPLPRHRNAGCTQETKRRGARSVRRKRSESTRTTPREPVPNLPLKGFATGALAGAFGSWVGLGGGFVSLPILTMALRLTQHQAHGTSLTAVTATGLAGASLSATNLVAPSLQQLWSCSHEFSAVNFGCQYCYVWSQAAGYASAGHVDVSAAAVIAALGMITAGFGARTAHALKASTLQKILGVFMVLVAPTVPLKDDILDYVRGLRKAPETEGTDAATDGEGESVSINYFFA